MRRHALQIYGGSAYFVDLVRFAAPDLFRQFLGGLTTKDDKALVATADSAPGEASEWPFGQGASRGGVPFGGRKPLPRFGGKKLAGSILKNSRRTA